MKELNAESECSTVGELKKLIEDMPDDWVLVVDVDGAEDVTHINTHWHGALTFDWGRKSDN